MEKLMRAVFALSTCVSILCVVVICLFLFANGIPTIAKIGVLDFLTGTEWDPRPNDPDNATFGIAPMIVASVYVTAGAILVGTPIGVLTAIFLAKFCPKRIHGFLEFIVTLLAGIPSVIYGFFGLIVIAPFISETFDSSGKNILTASLLLGMMILPTIISVSEAALRAVPASYYEGSLALGATHERSVFFVILPAAKSGVMASIILGVGRAIGETMAVIMVAGNQAYMPESILEGARTMTANIVLEMGYAAELHREALIATGVVLFVFILIINLLFSLVKRKAF